MNPAKKKTTQKNPTTLIIVVLSLLITVITLIALVGLAYAGVFVWAWQYDRKHARIAPEVDIIASDYIAQQYPDNDFELEKAYHIFKNNCYRVNVRSRSSQDTHFSLDYDDDSLELQDDSYQVAVTEGGNTYARLSASYQALVQDALAALPDVISCDSEFQNVEFRNLTLDMEYDTSMESEYGYITIVFLDDEENIHLERATELLLKVDNALTGAGIEYLYIDLTIYSEAYSSDSPYFHIYDVTQDILLSDDPSDILQSLWDIQELRRQALKQQWANSD